MRASLAVALGLVAASLHAPAAPRPQTVYSLGHGRIAAFAQDGQLVAWFAPSTRRCNTVHVLSLANGLQTVLPEQGAARNVTCMWPTTTARVSLALASRLPGTFVLWTLPERSPVPFDYLIGASVGSPGERRFQEIAHTKRGAGLWLGGVSGDRETLVYAVTPVDFVDEAGCLAGTGSCRLAVVGGGGVYRVVGRQAPRLLPGTGEGGALAVASAGGAVAYTRAATVDRQGRPVPGPDLPIEVVDARTGASLEHIVPRGAPLALALTPHHVVATLERTPIGLRVAWYARAGSAGGGGSVPVSRLTSPELAADDHWIVYRVGRSIRGIEIATRRVRTLAAAASEPVGLSLEGGRLAWAENLARGARIRALRLTP